MQSKPVTLAIVGAGNRAVTYAQHAVDQWENVRIVAVAEPDPTRRRIASQKFGINKDNQFESFQGLVDRPGLADAVINGTTDQMHYASSKPLIEAGYDLLLEKPIAPTEAEVIDLIDTTQQHQCLVLICHVLRYTPFYRAIKNLLNEGEIGDICAMHTSENVSYHHMATGFIRGKYNRKETSNPMMLAKCCHDTDLIAWMMTGIQPARIASFGSLTYFKSENAPQGSAKRCLQGCEIERTCPYSAKTMYIDRESWPQYAWEAIDHIENPTLGQKLESMKTDNPLGRCVWHSDNNVVDRQTLIVEFENGALASHNMFCSTARPTRTMHLIGTQGEIEGDCESGLIHIRKPSPSKKMEAMTERVIDINELDDWIRDDHGGGDSQIVNDFISLVRGDMSYVPGGSVSRIEDSLVGHRIAYAADTAMQERRVVELL